MNIYCFKRTATFLEESETTVSSDKPNQDKNSTMSIYINGELKQHGLVGQASEMQFSDMKHSILFRGFQGNVGSVLVYNRDLTSE